MKCNALFKLIMICKLQGNSVASIKEALGKYVCKSVVYLVLVGSDHKLCDIPMTLSFDPLKYRASFLFRYSSNVSSFNISISLFKPSDSV